MLSERVDELPSCSSGGNSGGNSGVPDCEVESLGELLMGSDSASLKCLSDSLGASELVFNEG